jgi:hypothetical protein
LRRTRPSKSSTTAEPSSPLDVCAAATTEAQCDALPQDAFCLWLDIHRVEDAASWMLDEPVGGCYAWESSGPQGCFDGVPEACQELSLQPAYREVDGELYLVTTANCMRIPIVPEGDVPWTNCRGEEFSDPPDVCYCLCGGPPADTSSTG